VSGGEAAQHDALPLTRTVQHGTHLKLLYTTAVASDTTKYAQKSMSVSQYAMQPTDITSHVKKFMATHPSMVMDCAQRLRAPSMRMLPQLS
jgi:hypothetical protein